MTPARTAPLVADIMRGITPVEERREGRAIVVSSEHRADIERYCRAYRVPEEWIFRTRNRWCIRLMGRYAHEKGGNR